MLAGNGYTEQPPNVDRLFRIISHQVRRELIFYFESVTSEDTASLDEVVAFIDNRVPWSNQADLRIGLWHTHLPKLSENGWVEFDARTEVIRYQGHGLAAQLLTETIAVFED